MMGSVLDWDVNPNNSMTPLATVTVAGSDAVPLTVTTMEQDFCPDTASGISALICQPTTPLVVKGPELYEIVASKPHTDTLAPPITVAFGLLHCPAAPRFWPKRVTQAPGDRGSV